MTATATIRAALLALPLACLSVAIAAPALAAFDPMTLPSVSGTVAQYSLTPVGDVDGLILDDGTEVHLPPRLGSQLVDAVKPGDRVTAHGLRARAVPMVQAVLVTNDATGRGIADDGAHRGPPPQHPPLQPMSAQGRIRQQLHGPRGDLNGVLLADGTIIRLPPPEAQRLRPLLQPGQVLAAQGGGVAGPAGRVLEASRIGTDPANLVALTPPPPPPPR